MKRIITIIILGAVFSLIGPRIARANDTVPIQTIILEAENQGLEGMIAVGEVIRNRANKAHRSFEAVCLAPRQFSAWNDRKYALKRLERASGKTWQVASKAWYASETSLQTKGSTHYHTKAVLPYWAVGKSPAAYIGDHVFYENIK